MLRAIASSLWNDGSRAHHGSPSGLRRRFAGGLLRSARALLALVVGLAMTASRPREQADPPSPPDRLPPRRGGSPSSKTTSAAGRLTGIVLAAGLALAPPAQAQETIWSGTVTVGTNSSIRGFLAPNCGGCTGYGSLNDRTFSYDGTNYNTRVLDHTTNNPFWLRIQTVSNAFTTKTVADLILVVEGANFPLSDGSSGQSGRQRTWNNAGLSWSAGTDVNLYLVRKDLPRLTAAEVKTDGRMIALTFSENLDHPTYTTTIRGAFTVTVDGATNIVQGVSGGMNKVNLSVSNAIRVGQTVVVSYDQSDAGTEAPGDSDGNKVADFTTGSGVVPSVVNNSDEGKPAKLTSARVNTGGDILEIVFDKALNDPIGFADLFSITVDGVGRGVSRLQFPGGGKNIQFVLSSPIFRGQPVVLSYAKPAGSDGITDDGYDVSVASFTTGEGGVPAVVNNSSTSPTCTKNPGDEWCGVVTVGKIDAIGTFFYGFNPLLSNPSVGNLSDKDFMYGSNSYTIDAVYTGTGSSLYFSLAGDDLTAADQAKLVLHVDGRNEPFAFSDATLAGSQTYLWSGTGLDWSSATNVTLRLRLGVPGQPTNLAAAANGGTQIDLTWTEPGSDGGSAITGYRIEVSENGGTDWNDLVADTGNTDTSYSHTGLSPGDTRHYRVSAITANGTSVASGTADATTIDPPRLSSATVIGIGTTMRLYFSENLDLSAGVPLPTAALNAFTFKVDGADHAIGTIYIPLGGGADNLSVDYSAKIYQGQTVTVSYDELAAGTDAIADSDGTKLASFTDFAVTNNSTQARPPPAAPTNLTATAGDAQVALSWDAPASDSGVTRHEYRYKTDGGYPAAWTVIANSAVGEANAAAFTVTPLTNGTAYTFELRAVSAGGDGAVAEKGPVTPMATAMSSDATLSGLAVNDGSSDLILTPTFASGMYAYTASSVANAVEKVTVTPTTIDAGATIEYLDARNMTLTDADTGAAGQQVAVAVGDTIIQVKVTAQNTTTTQTYTVTVNRAAPTPGTCTLNTGDLWCGVVAVGQTQVPVFGVTGYGFIGAVGDLSDNDGDKTFAIGANSYTIDRVTVATLSIGIEGYLTFSLTGALTATDKENLVLHVGSASFAFSDRPASSVHNYGWSSTLDWSSESTVTLRLREAPADATLSALVVKDGSRDLTLRPGFASGTTSYTTSVANRTDEVTVTPTKSHARARIEYLDASDMTLADAGTAAGQQVTLVEGANVIKVKVTAEDGTTMETYTVTVTPRAADAPGVEGELRLTNEEPYTHPDGYEGVAGRVEIFHNGRWGTVCDDGFSRETTSRFIVELDANGNATANVTENEHTNNAPALVCEAMGYETGEYASGYGRPGPSQPSALASYSPLGETYPTNGPGPIWLDDMTCAAGDADQGRHPLPAPLAHCAYAGWGLHNCTHNEDAGVPAAGTSWRAPRPVRGR